MGKYQDFVGILYWLDWILKGIVDGNYRVEIYIHLLDPTSQESAAPESQGRRLDSCQGPKVAVFAAVPG
jgi:hypothetical protein